MFKFSKGELSFWISIIVLSIFNPIFGISSYFVFYYVRKKDMKMKQFQLLIIFLIMLCTIILNISDFLKIYFNFFINYSDLNLFSFWYQSLRIKMFPMFLLLSIILPVLNYNYIRKYYNLDEQLDDRILNNKNKIKDEDKSIFDLDIKSANENMKTKNKYIRLGHNKNLNPVYHLGSSQNMVISGTTGSGKTTVLRNIVKDSLLQNNHLIYINGKGNRVDTNKIIKMCQENNKEYVVFDLGIDNLIKYNPFQNSDLTTIRDMIINLSDWSEEHYQSNASSYYQIVLELMNLDDFDIYKFLNIIENKDLLLEKIEEREQNQFKKKANKIIVENGDVVKQSIGRIMELFGGDGDKILKSDGIDILTALSSEKAIIFNLNPNKYPLTSKVLFRLLTLDIRKTFEHFDGNTREITAVYDEFGTYATEEFLNVLNQSRSSGYRNYLAVQTVIDVQSNYGQDFLDRIIDNCNSFFFMRSNSPTSASYCADVIATHEKMSITRIVDGLTEGEKGTAKQVHQYFYHPSVIKYLPIGQGIYVCKDNQNIEYVYSRYS